MGIFTDNSKSVPGAKNMYWTQNVDLFSIVPSSNAFSYVSRFMNFVHSLWSPFNAKTSQNYLLQSNMISYSEDSNNCQFNLDKNYVGFSLLKLFKSENSLETQILSFACDYKNKEFLKKSLTFLECQEWQNNIDSKSLLQSINKCDMLKLNFENNNFLMKKSGDINKTFCEGKIMENKKSTTFILKGECLQNNKSSSSTKVGTNSVSFEIAEKANYKKCPLKAPNCTLKNPKSTDKNMDVLTQELILRKNKKMSKLSKKRRRRQRKKVVGKVKFPTFNCNAVEQVCAGYNLDSSVKIDNVDSFENNLKKYDDIVFEACDNKLSNSVINSSVSFILSSTSTSESDSDSDFDCTENVTVHMKDFELECNFMNTLSYVLPSYLSCTDVTHIVNVSEMSDDLKRINYQWQNAMLNVPSHPKIPIKVTFAPDEELLDFYPVDSYDRKGEWEIYALERFRFKRRIQDIEKILSPCLSQSHREKIQLQLQTYIKF